MFPFWDLVIQPVFRAVDAKRIVEIGALRGENTVQLLEALGPDAELHVIDPLPAFDPAEHERQFPGQYVFHRALSHDVLEDLPPMDVALIDGDHNWYTVYHEARMLAAVARKAGRPMPVMIFHDVLWPYGRRDLYYDPSTIPEEFRQPYERKGIPLQGDGLVNRGGVNPTLCNAIKAGGPRNGVMTGIEDFVAEHDEPLRHLVIPIYFGLSVVAEESRLADQPALAELFARLESAEGRGELLELAERTRLQAVQGHHAVYFQREQQRTRAADRYLGLLGSALLDEHYLDNELRLHHLASCIEQRQPVSPEKLADPTRASRKLWRQVLEARRSGTLDKGGDPLVPAYFPATTMGQPQLDALKDCLDVVRSESVVGDLVECGTGRGGGAIFLRGYLAAWDLPGTAVWVVDRFRASPEQPTSHGGPLPGGGLGFPDVQPDLNAVRDLFDRFGLLDKRVRFLQGPPADVLAGADMGKVALLRIGRQAGGDAGEVLDALYDHVTVGGFVVVEDHKDPATRKAVRQFRERRGITDPIERVDWSCIRWRKTVEAPVAGRQAVTAPARVGAPLAAPAPPKPVDLSVVVVFHNMAREAERTLHSLSRAYQQGIDDLDYEVIVVENGSAEDQRLGEDHVTSFGPEFRYIDMGPDAPATPVPALNTGVRAAGGRNIALMIDGAHVLTPGVLRWAMAGLRAYDPAIVLTQQWYVGPGQQPSVTGKGYDQAAEDELFDRIAWPQDGYALFDVGHFISDRDWFDGMWESNCLFVPRKLLEQVGAFEEGFTTPGGGYANLELYERLGSSPDVHVTTILGEGSFHQVHGGTTTNAEVEDDRNEGLADYAGEYRALRGRPFQGPGRTLHYIGTMHPRALRTKGRRRVAAEFWTARAADDPGIPTSPSPIPDELRLQYTEALWESLAWQTTTWLGAPTEQLPTDLFAYQEAVHRVRPDWVIVVDTVQGGRTLFLASVCELIGHGQVAAVGATKRKTVPDHDRITVVSGGPFKPSTVEAVGELVGDGGHGLVVIGGRYPVTRVIKAFDLYSPFVTKGSYAIIEDTMVNGHPVWPTFGPGPREAANRIVARRDAFGPDGSLERFGVTFNRHGFLKRFR